VNVDAVLAPCDELVLLVEEVSVLDLAQKSHFDRHPDHIKALVHEYKLEVVRNHQIQL
jgi:ABC-type cobalamin transport system ATPase subunit